MGRIKRPHAGQQSHESSEGHYKEREYVKSSHWENSPAYCTSEGSVDIIYTLVKLKVQWCCDLEKLYSYIGK